MKQSLAPALTPIFERDPDQILLTGDLGHGVFDSFRERFPQQFINMGVSEPHMVAFASGLALHGKKVWIYSMPSFLVLRCLEAIRNLVCDPALPVRFIGNGAGFSYGNMGSTHHSLEDIAALKALANMQFFLPASAHDLPALVSAMNLEKGPGYLRLHHQGALMESAPTLETSSFRFYGASPSLPSQKLRIAFGPPQKKWLLSQDTAQALVTRFPLSEEDWSALKGQLTNISQWDIETYEEHSVTGGLGESFRTEFEKRFGPVRNWKLSGLVTPTSCAKQS